MICYTDGACSGNGSESAPGGFGVVVLDDDENCITTYSKGCIGTTNNREELKAILYTLIRYGKDERPIVYSDSAYAVNTFNNWMWSWANRGWLKSDNKEPENLDLIQTYFDFYNNRGHRIELRKCPGHAGLHWNEVADKLAVSAKDGAKEVSFKVLKFNEPNKNNTIIRKETFNI